MANVVLVDTNVLIDFERGDERAAARLHQLERQSKVAVSVVTEMDLTVGCRNKKELRALDRFVRRFEVFGLSSAIGRIALDLLRQYNLSHGLLIADALIAATALTVHASLLTAGQRHFRLVEGLDLRPYP